MIFFRYVAIISFFMLSLSMSGCADWQTTPTTLDKHHGVAYRQMVKNQTLYPEHSKEIRQELILDGQKSEEIIRAYRNTDIDLEQSKSGITINLGGNGGGSSSGN